VKKGVNFAKKKRNVGTGNLTACAINIFMEIDIFKEKELFPTINTGTGTTNTYKLNLIVQKMC